MPETFSDLTGHQYRWAIQIAGCPVLFLSHDEAPTLDDGDLLRYETANPEVTTPYAARHHAIGERSRIVFSRALDLDRGVVGADNVRVELISDRSRPATCPLRLLGARGFRDMPWAAQLVDESISAEDDTPEFTVLDVGQTITAGDIVYMGREAFIVGGVGASDAGITVTVAARAVLGTDRHTHRGGRTGDRPYLTPRPLTWRGRRALIWRARMHQPSGIGRWTVRYRADLNTEPHVGTSSLVFDLVSIVARVAEAVGTTITPRRLHQSRHVFANNVGCFVAVRAFADKGALWRGTLRDNVDAVDTVLPVDDGVLDGRPTATARHAAVADIAPAAADAVYHRHPRCVPVETFAGRPKGVIAYGVDGGGDPIMTLSHQIGEAMSPGAGLHSSPMGETIWVRLVDTSDGPVVVSPARLYDVFNSRPIARSRELMPAGGDRHGVTFARVSAGGRASEPQAWVVVSKIAPEERVTILLSNAPARWWRDTATDARLLRLMNQHQSVDQLGYDTSSGWYPRWITIPGPDVSPQMSALVWSWGIPQDVVIARADYSGDLDAEVRFNDRVPGQTVVLRRSGEAVVVPRASLPRAWYQHGEVLTLDGPTGVGDSGRLVLEVREDGEDKVIARCVATSEAEVETGVWAVTIEIYERGREFHMPTIVEAVERPRRYTFSPAFVVEGRPAGETVARLLTSAGGDGIMSEHDTEVFGAGYRDGTGSISTAVMGRDLDVEGVLGLPSIAGSRTSVIGRPGDRIRDITEGLVRGAGYALDLLTRSDTADPHDGCIVALRPIRTPTRAEIRGTLGVLDILSDPGPVLVEPGLRNVFMVSANFTSDGPQIELRATADSSILAHGEARAREIKLAGVYFESAEEALAALRPMLTRATDDEAFPRARYSARVRSPIVATMGIGDAWRVVSPRAPRSNGALGIDGVARIIAVDYDAGAAFSEVLFDYYGEASGGRAPCCAVVDVLSPTQLKVAPHFFCDPFNPLDETPQTDLALLVSPTWGDGLGTAADRAPFGLVGGCPLRLFPAGDPDNITDLEVSAYDLVNNTVTFTGAHGVVDPGGEVDPRDYIAVIEPALYDDAPAGHRAYFNHGRDAIT